MGFEELGLVAGNSGAPAARFCLRPSSSGLLSRSRKASWISARRRGTRTLFVKMQAREAIEARESNGAKKGLDAPTRNNIAQVG